MYSRGVTPPPEDESPGIFGWFNSFFQQQDIQEEYTPPEIPIQRNLFRDYQEPRSQARQEPPSQTRSQAREESYRQEPRRTPKYFKKNFFPRSADPFSRYEPPRPESFSRHSEAPEKRLEPPSETREEYVYNNTQTVQTALDEIQTSIDVIRQLGDETHRELLNQLLALKQAIRDPAAIQYWDKNVWYKMLGEACVKGDRNSCLKIFGLSSNASRDQIKQAYKTKILEFHPDKQQGNNQMAQILNDAYAVIR